MTIFNILSDILYTKNKSSLCNIDDESIFSPFLINRWISMYSSNTAKLCNIINKYIGIFEDKKSLYSLFMILFPKVSNKKINYIKKVKEDKGEDNKALLTMIAKNRELSTREICKYIEMLNSK